MTEDLNTIARRIVCAPLPEAKDWQNYYESLIQLASRLLKVEKHHEFFFAGSLTEDGKFFRADDLGDVDLMISSLDYIPSACDLVNVHDLPGFVKVKVAEVVAGDVQYYPAENLTHTYLGGLPVGYQPLLALIASRSNFKDLQCSPMLDKLHNAAYSIDFTSSFPSPSSQLERSTGQLNPLQKSMIHDIAKSLAIGYGDENARKTCDENVKLTIETLEKLPQQNLTSIFGVLGKITDVSEDGQTISKDKQEVTVDKQKEELESAPPTTMPSCSHGNEASVESTPDQNSENESDASKTGNDKSAAKPDGIYPNQIFKQLVATRLFASNERHSHDNDLNNHPEGEACGTYISNKSPKSTAELPRKSGIDVVPTLKCTGWPTIAVGWLTRTRKWPTAETIAQIKDSGFHLVGKYPEKLSEEEAKFVFRLSFSKAENILCMAMNEVQKQCYRLLKASFHETFKPLSECFTSYHIKTLLFWQCEEKESKEWIDLGECIFLLLHRLLQALEDRSLRHYFISQLDLFDGLTKMELSDLHSHVLTILQSPEKYFQDLEISIKKSAELVSAKAESTETQPEELAVPEVLKTKTFQQLHSEEVEMLGQEILIELRSEQPPSDEYSPEFHYIIAAMKEAIDTGKFSPEGFEKVLSVSKDFLYFRHVGNLNDMLNSDNIRSIVLSDFCLLADWVRDLSVKPMESLQAAASSDDEAMRLSMSSMQDGGFDFTQFFPDGGNIIESFSNVLQ
ncbi:uncharacterized protein LOC130662859 [Hydractinia symbiolongicarpus]|uniref:uncharacterized protein LOC130662859 n=1 Tax=Hydractinia symbiolongicarpus TaxID=13093 RepID=UPI00254CC113|nr:uncharacterized protein LOC130662859 [Hydractinia symbiolongicarpus]XP_057317784.1 uncharacterized protein LOC130662859 [Hydractinia symbiolongicarpus]